MIAVADPERGRGQGANLLFGKLVAKNWMKFKEIGPRGGPPLDPTMDRTGHMKVN